MKRYVALAAVILVAALGLARAEGPDDLYLQVYSLIQEGDSYDSNGQPDQARVKYLQAQTALRTFQKSYPSWNNGVVNFRLEYLASRIAEVSAKVPGIRLQPATPPAPQLSPGAPAASPAASPAVPGPGQTTGTANPGASSTPAPPPVKPSAPNDWLEQLNSLKARAGQLEAERERLQSERAQWQTERSQLQSDKGLLEAKLKEAISMQSAAVNADLAKAQERIKLLEQDDTSLRVALDKAKSQPQQAKAKSSKADKAAAALEAENKLLKKELAELKAASAAKGNAGEPGPQLAQAQAQMAVLQSEKQILELEKTALQDRVKQLTVATAAPAAPAPVPPPISAAPAPAPGADTRQLERERDDLRKQLEAANHELASRKSKALTARITELEHQLGAVRARLEVYEARRAPYTPEELALFQRPEPSLPAAAPVLAAAPAPVAAVATNTDTRSVASLSPASAKLVVEARGYFSQGQYDKAEEDYLQVLREDQKNVPVLANLAAIEVERNHLDAAEANITQAVALNPDDAYCLSVLGNLRFRQGKYDQAIDALSRAATLDPKNAEIQNYLGLSFSEKGMRGPAETALRKAIQLDPGYGSAHNNLAVVYITQQPPAVELARWHYERALAAGHPRNPELEKLLDAKGK
jgi:Flp pilus assembly protein TadD